MDSHKYAFLKLFHREYEAIWAHRWPELGSLAGHVAQVQLGVLHVLMLDRLGLRLQQVEVVVGGARQAEVQRGRNATVHQPRSGRIKSFAGRATWQLST